MYFLPPHIICSKLNLVMIEASSTDSLTTHENNTAASTTNNYTDISTFFTGGTMAIDMGTTRLKLSHRPSLSSQMNTQHKPPMPVVSVDREGFRSTPSLVWLPSSEEDKEDALVGRLAESRLYDTRGGRVVHPRDFLLQGGGNGSSDIEEAIQQSIRDVASNALDQALGASSGSSAKSSNPLFVLDASMSTSGSYNVRPIFTYPVQSTTTTVDTSRQQYVERYKQVVNGLASPDGIAEYVPEPVAIVTGAEYYNLLPPKSASSGSSVLIVDVGGTKTSISLVAENDEILYSSSLPLGGDTFIDLLVSYLVKDFYGTSEEATASESSTTSLSTKPKLNDPTALQRLYEASTTAIHELSNKTRSEINIPYLTMDLNTRQPKHLEVGMSRNVVYAEVEGWIRNELVPHLQDENNNSGLSLLSRSLAPPTNLATLISSIIMSCLESTSHTPSMLRSILLVGGGGRIPLVRSAVQEGVGYLAGDAYVNGGGGGETKRLIIPEDGMGEELAVLGAAVWGSSKVD